MYWKLWISLLVVAMVFGCFTCVKGQNYYHGTTGMANENISHCVEMTCSGNFYDDGGPGATGPSRYANGVNWIYRTFCPNVPGRCMRATFSQFEVECANPPCTICWDVLRAQNGPTQNSPVLWQRCSLGALPPVTTSTDASGCLTFRFFSDGSVRWYGWAATLSCVPCAANTAVDNNDCSEATTICSNTSFMGASIGPGVVGDGCSGCNTSEHFTNWYSFCVSVSGTLQFMVSPTNAADDYDFALYGPNTGCAALGVPVRCSYAGLSGNTGLNTTAVDVSEDVLGDSWVSTLPVVAGECYYLMISKWSSGGSGFTVDFTGSTASLDCTPLDVKLLEFSCRNDLLTWRTASELNIAKFRVYGSDDLVSWYLVDEVLAGKGVYSIPKQDNFDYFKLTEVSPSEVENLLDFAICSNDQIAVKYEVYNILGQMILAGEGSFNTELLIGSNTSSGAYVVREIKGQKSIVFKVFKK